MDILLFISRQHHQLKPIALELVFPSQSRCPHDRICPAYYHGGIRTHGENFSPTPVRTASKLLQLSP